MTGKRDEGKLNDTGAFVIDRLVRQARFRGWVMVVAGVGFALDLVLTIVVTFVLSSNSAQQHQLAAQQHQLAAQAQSIHQAQIAACEQVGNKSRADEIVLWKGVLALSLRDQPRQTPAEKAQAGKFVAYVSRVFAPIDCAKLYPPPATKRLKERRGHGEHSLADLAGAAGPDHRRHPAAARRYLRGSIWYDVQQRTRR